MLISIGHRQFVENNFIVEIFKPESVRAMRIRRQAALSRMLINASEGRSIRSIIKLSSGHVVLSAVAPRTLESRRAKNTDPSIADPCMSAHTGLNHNTNHPEPHEQVDRRKESDRRRFSYTAYIPERRYEGERRIGHNDKQRRREKQ